MDIGSILLIAALALLTAAFIARPLLRHEGRRVGEVERRLSTLEAERERILSALQELEMDRAMGKIEASDFLAQREALVAAGAETLREIDSLTDDARPAEIPATASDEELEAQIEAAVAQIRATGDGAAGYCPTCGTPHFSEDRFCSRCGASLQVEKESAG